MADHTLPTATSVYDPDFLDEMHGRIDDAVKMAEAPTNPPTGYLRWNRTTKKLEEWSGAAWVVTNTTVSVAGGGTGAVDATNARTNLGIGSLGTQNAGAVAITGGTIAGITSLSLSGNIVFATHNANDIGTDIARPRKIYVGDALVIPVGVDKYATS